MKIGYIGLGIMGQPAARNILRAGYALGVWARRLASTDALASNGATVYPSAKALAADSDIIITNVSDSPDVEAIVLGENGISSGIRPGGIVIDMSTIAPSVVKHIANELQQAGAFFLDAPVSGGEVGAINGSLTFMVGGDAKAFNRALPVLQTMGKTITHIGESGCGQIAKACNQIIIGATLSGVADAFRLASAGSADLAKIRQALLGGFAASKVLEVHAQRMIDGDYAPGFKASLHDKDISIAIAEAKQYGVCLPTAEDFHQRLRELIQSGGSDLDSSAVGKN